MSFQYNKKNLGVVLTPPKTTDYIISKLSPINEKALVLDPCVGPGIFVKALLKAGVRKDMIHTFDIEYEYKRDIEDLGVQFQAMDSLLSLFPDSYNKYDFIVGNPPYLNKSSAYVKKNKNNLKKIYGKINAHETYSMFIVNSIWRLRNGGKLGFITSDSFLTLKTHAKLRKFILQNCKINEILLAPKELFGDQQVSTNTAIIVLTKCTGKENKGVRGRNVINVIPRVESEENYDNPKVIYKIMQKKYELLPFNLFFVDVEEEIIRMFEQSSKLEDHIKGYIGMHTHDNLKHIAAVEGTKLAELFTKRNEKTIGTALKFQIISKKELEKGAWKPYLKRGGNDQYYRPISEAIEWSSESVPKYDIPNNVPFEKEGITISGVSSRLAARYMPVGCYWDSNKSIGFLVVDNSISIPYALGLLNSSLYNYLAKGIVNNTNSIQITGIHALPFIVPDDTTKEKIEYYVKKIIENKKKDSNYDIKTEQKAIDDLIFNFYASEFHLTKELKNKLDKMFSIYKLD